MKRTSLTLLFILGIVFFSDAQITLPYTNGFDNNTSNSDWVLYRKGLTSNNGNPTHTWEPHASPGAATPPNYLWHDYPVGYVGTEMTNDWLVSKSINFTNGAKLSLKAWVYAIDQLMPGDSIEIYLLKNSQDPATATKTKIASLRSLTVNTGSMNTPTWKDTANIIIPATTGSTYLAIRYTCISNWYTVAIDDLKLVANTTGISGTDKEAISFRLYPNPATSVLQWNMNAADLQKLSKQEGVLFNYNGRELKRFPVKDASLDISFLQPGMYYVKMGGTVVPFTKL